MFSLKTANTVPPTDVLQEVTFYGAGGTGEPRCENPELQIFDWQENLETGCEIYAYGCGWQNNEIVDVTIVYPDGKKKEYQIKAHINFPALDKYASVDIQQRLLVTDPAGLYKIKVQGASGNAEKEISVLEPNGPSAYYYGDALWLQGFMPNESLRLIAYQRVSSGAANSSFVGWIEFNVDAKGNAQVSIENKANIHYIFAILGRSSGQVLPKEPGSCVVIENVDRNLLGTDQQSCGSLQSRLNTSALARVTFTDGTDMRIRANPGLSQKIIDKVPEGTQVNILDEPKCVDGITWWKIHTNSGLEGWMAEYQDDVYLLEPLP